PINKKCGEIKNADSYMHLPLNRYTKSAEQINARKWFESSIPNNPIQQHIQQHIEQQILQQPYSQLEDIRQVSILAPIETYLINSTAITHEYEATVKWTGYFVEKDAFALR
ncbi:30876_t:CDS:2, partial [Racocetra persica]